MANDNIRTRKWITKILKEGNFSTSEIHEKIMDMGYRNTPTMAQLKSILGKDRNYINTAQNSIEDKKYTVIVWELKKEMRKT